MNRLDKARQQVESGKFREEDAMEMREWEKARMVERDEKERRIVLEEGDRKMREKKMASVELGYRKARTMALARREVIAQLNGY